MRLISPREIVGTIRGVNQKAPSADGSRLEPRRAQSGGAEGEACPRQGILAGIEDVLSRGRDVEDESAGIEACLYGG